MKTVILNISLTEELGIRSVSVTHNDTGLESDSELVKLTCIALLKSFSINSQDIALQDILNSNDISRLTT